MEKLELHLSLIIKLIVQKKSLKNSCYEKYSFKIKRIMIFFLHKNCLNKLYENLKAKDTLKKKKIVSIRLNQQSNYTHKMIDGSSKTIKKSLYVY